MDKVKKDFYFEDLPLGFKNKGGHWLITKKEVIQFGQKFDPLPIHVDEIAAKESDFGSLIAAGTHLLAISTGLSHQLHGEDNYHYIAGLGFDSVHFYLPARPGDILSMELEVVSSRKSISKPQQGILHISQLLINQNSDVVAKLIGKAMMKTRPL